MGCCLNCILYRIELNEQYKLYGKNPNWMTEYFPMLKHKKVFEMIVPGSHNSGMYHSSGILKSDCKCQNISIIKQLGLGVRFLDFKFCCKSESKRDVWISNRAIPSMRLNKAMLELNHFLVYHPKEFIIVRLNQDLQSEKICN